MVQSCCRDESLQSDRGVAASSSAEGREHELTFVPRTPPFRFLLQSSPTFQSSRSQRRRRRVSLALHSFPLELSLIFSSWCRSQEGILHRTDLDPVPLHPSRTQGPGYPRCSPHRIRKDTHLPHSYARDALQEEVGASGRVGRTGHQSDA